MKNELYRMCHLETMPLLQDGVKVHYEGSIDKQGGNADWDWHLYQDAQGEWVLLDVAGAGCLYNFVQHRYPDSPEPTFRFYFDGEEQPRFTIRHSQFGEVYPFVEPLASRYIGPPDDGRGPIRVVRSFVPMPFTKCCRITSDVRLEGCRRDHGEGGWGHVIYHTYSEPQGTVTFSAGDEEYRELKEFWKRSGCALLPFQQEERTISSTFTLQPGEARTVFEMTGAALIAGLVCRTEGFRQADLAALWVRITWDGHVAPDVECPFGCFFGNELGHHTTRYLLTSLSPEGEYTNYFPMPFCTGAHMEIQNRGERAIAVAQVSVRHTQEYNALYAAHPFGYFRCSPYYTRCHTEGSDSIIAQVKGSGHMVAAVVTGFGKGADGYANCEGDVRIHFDGIRTPQIESDGSESYVCYGWGFASPPEGNPASGYDGRSPASTDWSMARYLLGDTYPFLSEMRFGIESAECNNAYMEHSGAVFYYGVDTVRLQESMVLNIGDPASEKENEYISLDQAPVRELMSFFEGDDDDVPVTLHGRYTQAGCTFCVTLLPDTAYVILRRVSDQQDGRQKATVFIDGEEVTECAWYFADSNSCKRWLEDEFVIPSRYLKGKATISVRIVPCAVERKVSWNAFGYRVFCVKALG